MSLTLPCQVCGESLPPLSEDDEKLLRSGKPFVLKHDVCPHERAAAEAAKPRLRRFEARVSIVEVIAPEVPPAPHGGLFVPGGAAQVVGERDSYTQTAATVELAGFVAHADGPNLADALRPLALALGEKWMQVEQNAPLADTPVLADLEES